MTKRLQEVFDEALKLPDEDQDSIAELLLYQLQSDQRWNHLFEKYADRVEILVEEARNEYRLGKTKPLNLDEM